MSKPNLPPDPGMPNRKAAERAEAIAKIITAGVKRSGLTREEVAKEMAKLLDVTFTPSMLNDFSSVSKKYTRFPVEFVDAFCEVVEDDRLQKFAAGEVIVDKAEAFDAMEKALKHRRKRRKS